MPWISPQCRLWQRERRQRCCSVVGSRSSFHVWDMAGKSQPKSGGNPWKIADIMGIWRENQRRFFRDHDTQKGIWPMAGNLLEIFMYMDIMGVFGGNWMGSTNTWHYIWVFLRMAKCRASDDFCRRWSIKMYKNRTIRFLSQVMSLFPNMKISHTHTHYTP